MSIRPDAQKAIHIASIAAAGVTISPIPFADSFLLIPIQTTMIIAIYKAYDKKISKGFLTGILRSTMTSTIGKTLSGNILKFIPGVGSIVGGVIDTGIAVALTQAIGNELAKALEEDKINDNFDIIEILEYIFLNFNIGKKKK